MAAPERTGRLRLLLLHNGQRCSAQLPCASSREGAVCARARRVALCTASPVSPLCCVPISGSSDTSCRGGCWSSRKPPGLGAVQQKNHTHSSHDVGLKVCVCAPYSPNDSYIDFLLSTFSICDPPWFLFPAVTRRRNRVISVTQEQLRAPPRRCRGAVPGTAPGARGRRSGCSSGIMFSVLFLRVDF